VRRREFIALFSSAAAWPLATEAQQAGKVYRVGWLSPFSGPRPTFRDAMRERGYVEGNTFAFEIRLAEGRYELLPKLAFELVHSRVDIIMANAPSAVRAAQQATREIPIVFWWGNTDLVESGTVASFARPGGNLTGVNILVVTLNAKRLELLVEAVPAAKTVAVLTHPPPAKDFWLDAGVRKVAQDLGVKLHQFDVDPATSGYEALFDSMGRVGVDALLVPSSPKFTQDRKPIVALAAKHQIPAIYEWSWFAADGGLMAYSPSWAEMDRQAADYVDRILRGAWPGDLPIQQPTKFELVINLKTAKALGITIPPTLLARADEVIE
jgi:ABC-type uncharacterized transport system substrate-binding protein